MKRFVKNLIFLKIFKLSHKGHEEPRGMRSHGARFATWPLETK